MEYYVLVESSSGTKYGEIHSIVGWNNSAVLDRAGAYSFEMPAADPMAALLQPKRVVTCYAMIGGAITQVGSGIIDEVSYALDASGRPNGMLTISGSDRLRELTYRNVGSLTITAATTGPADLIALAPTGWTLDTVNGYNVTAKTITQTYKGETVLDGFIKLTSVTGEHFRAGVGQKIVWTKNDQPTSGARAFYGIDPIAAEGVCIITQLKEVTDSAEGYIGRLYAFGGGTGTAQITLNGATCSYTGYAIGNDTKGYYLEHAATWAAYGIEGVRVWNDQLTSQSLMEVAYEMQRRSLTPPKTYDLQLVGLTTTLLPGTTIRVVAHQWLDGYHAINIDADLVILSVTNRLDAQGLRTVGLTCSSTDRPVVDDTGVIVNGLSAMVNTTAYDQPVAASNITGLVTPSAHNLLSVSHGDTLTGTVVRGDILVGNSTPKWGRLAIGKSGAMLRSDGTDLAYTTYVQRRTFVKDVADNTASNLFRITTVNETGSTDGGGYSVFVHALIGHMINSGSGAGAVKSFTAQFAHVNIGAGNTATTAVSEVVETASAATASATRDIGAVTMTTVATSNYLTDVQFTVDTTGSSPQPATVIADVELVWYGYLTPPVMSQL